MITEVAQLGGIGEIGIYRLGDLPGVHQPKQVEQTLAAVGDDYMAENFEEEFCVVFFDLISHDAVPATRKTALLSYRVSEVLQMTSEIFTELRF